MKLSPGSQLQCNNPYKSTPVIQVLCHNSCMTHVHVMLMKLMYVCDADEVDKDDENDVDDVCDLTKVDVDDVENLR